MDSKLTPYFVQIFNYLNNILKESISHKGKLHNFTLPAHHDYNIHPIRIYSFILSKINNSHSKFS